MKRTILLMGASLLLAPALSFAAQQTWTGEISDSMCGANHQAMAKSGQKVNPRECTLECVKAGANTFWSAKDRFTRLRIRTCPISLSMLVRECE
jgi:hypothetical protein